MFLGAPLLLYSFSNHTKIIDDLTKHATIADDTVSFKTNFGTIISQRANSQYFSKVFADFRTFSSFSQMTEQVSLPIQLYLLRFFSGLFFLLYFLKEGKGDYGWLESLPMVYYGILSVKLGPDRIHHNRIKLFSLGTRRCPGCSLLSAYFLRRELQDDSSSPLCGKRV